MFGYGRGSVCIELVCLEFYQVAPGEARLFMWGTRGLLGYGIGWVLLLGMVVVLYGYSPEVSYLLLVEVRPVCFQFHPVGQAGAGLVCGVPGVQVPGVAHQLED